MKAGTAVAIATIYLVVYCVLLNIDLSPVLTGIAYLSVPVIILFLVFIVLFDDSRKYPQLHNDEWGYTDKDKDDLGMF
ncbi:MAG: hypothetical protein JST19_09405 [Bacteroidetes bacterium]|nr:hypothetical protein [Bacteroidota bacterium]